ncbi:hypothetical protein FRB94_011636, partial [Tulasnella sp. JGI-2019a]
MNKLKIQCGSRIAGVTIGLFSGGADRLRHIDLRDCPMLWSSRPLSQLETLAITGKFSPSTDELTDIFRRCLKLRMFGIKSSYIRVSRSKVEVVHLPALILFGLELKNTESFDRIISS